MNKKTTGFFLNNYIITVVISIIIILLSPSYFSKFQIQLVDQQLLIANGHKVYYGDLNNDNFAEKIIGMTNTAGNAGIMIYQSNGDFIDQYNFTKESCKNMELYFGDQNRNNYKEIYALTISNDSAFLSILELLDNKKHTIKEVFIDKISSSQLDENYYGGLMHLEDLNADGEEEMVLSMNAGYSGNPRNVYRYDFKTGVVNKSPHLTNVANIKIITDVNGDQKKEIFAWTHSSGNTIDSLFTKRSDYSTWLNVLDHNLNFIFEPIEMSTSYTALNTFPFLTSENEYRLMCLINSRQSNEFSDRIVVYNFDGIKTQEKLLPKGHYQMLWVPETNNFYLYNSLNGQLDIIDRNLNFLETKAINTGGRLERLDLDGDNEQEWAFIASNTVDISIFRNDFNSEVKIKLFEDGESVRLGNFLNGDGIVEIYIQKGKNYYRFKYGENPNYYFRFFYYLGVILVVFIIVSLISRVQQVKFMKKRALEKEILELQLKTIKNQVDPHFVFNAMNTISAMSLSDDKMAIDDFICRFSDLMRATLSGSDKISISLRDEIEYVKNFIELQQIRFNHRFKYKIHYENELNLDQMVPKHVLYAYVENAIKHGFSRISENGMLILKILEEKNYLLMGIQDNGEGFVKSAERKKNSTGSGIRIMEKMFHIYTKLYQRKIDFKIKENQNNGEQSQGVTVDIKLYHQKKKPQNKF